MNGMLVEFGIEQEWVWFTNSGFKQSCRLVLRGSRASGTLSVVE